MPAILVAQKNGVTYINDSKGTNVGATLAALEGLDGPLVLLLGGQGKGGDFAPLVPVCQQKARAVLVYGEDAELIAQALGNVPNVVRCAPDFATIVQQAAALAQAGDTVLLSPACASFDMFTGYTQRGNEFVRLVGEL